MPCRRFAAPIAEGALAPLIGVDDIETWPAVLHPSDQAAIDAFAREALDHPVAQGIIAKPCHIVDARRLRLQQAGEIDGGIERVPAIAPVIGQGTLG